VWRFRQKLGPHSLTAQSEQKSESASLLRHTYFSYFVSWGFRAKSFMYFSVVPRLRHFRSTSFPLTTKTQRKGTVGRVVFVISIITSLWRVAATYYSAPDDGRKGRRKHVEFWHQIKSKKKTAFRWYLYDQF